MEEPTVVITKLDAAHRQIRIAIRMYFADDDLVAIHTLTCAAREIYEKHCKAANSSRMFDLVQAEHPAHTEKALWSAFNDVRNFLKHPDSNGDLNVTVELSDRINKLMLFCTCYDCAMLCAEQTPVEVNAYHLWFMATEPNFDSDWATGLAWYPGIRDMSAVEQRRAGRQFVEDTLSGKFA